MLQQQPHGIAREDRPERHEQHIERGKREGEEPAPAIPRAQRPRHPPGVAAARRSARFPIDHDLAQPASLPTAGKPECSFNEIETQS